MSDILSQQEIDELLNALTTGAEIEQPQQQDQATGSIRVYDFRTANRFPKEQMRTFNIVFQSFAQLFSNRLTAILRSSCECEVLSVEECSFNEFNNSLPIPAILAVFRAPPMTGSQLIEISPEVAYMIVSRLFGGDISTGENAKQFTEIELAIVERVLRQSIGIYDEAWEKVLGVNAQLERIETSTQFAQVTGLNEPVAVVGLNLRVGNDEGIVSICIPHAAIEHEQVAKQINTRLWYSSVQETSEVNLQPEFIRQKLIRSPVSLVAFFNSTPATVIDIVNLQVGDVVRLNHRTKDPLTVNVAHIPKFFAKVGTIGTKCALQIVDIIKEET